MNLIRLRTPQSLRSQEQLGNEVSVLLFLTRSSMSWWHFNYQHHYLQDMIESIQKEIDTNSIPNEEWWANDFNEETLQTFREAIFYLKKAYAYTHAIDYLLCGDTSEDSHMKFLTDLLNK